MPKPQVRGARVAVPAARAGASVFGLNWTIPNGVVAPGNVPPRSVPANGRTSAAGSAAACARPAAPPSRTAPRVRAQSELRRAAAGKTTARQTTSRPGRAGVGVTRDTDGVADAEHAYGRGSDAEAAIATVRRMYEAFARRDIDGALAFAAPDVELMPHGTAARVGAPSPTAATTACGGTSPTPRPSGTTSASAPTTSGPRRTGSWSSARSQGTTSGRPRRPARRLDLARARRPRPLHARHRRGRPHDAGLMGPADALGHACADGPIRDALPAPAARPRRRGGDPRAAGWPTGRSTPPPPTSSSTTSCCSTATRG